MDFDPLAGDVVRESVTSRSGDPDLGAADGSSAGGKHPATSPGSEPATQDVYSHVSVDSEGAPVGKLIAESGRTPSQLHDYLKNSWGGAPRAAEFERTGVWPHDVQIPKDPSVLKANGTINWDEVPQGGHTIEAGKAVK